MPVEDYTEIFRKTGAACIAVGLQNTHSGNLSVREDSVSGGEMYITRSGAMLGHIGRDDICAPGLDEPRPEIKAASSESEVHRRILAYSGAVIHAHPLYATVISAGGEKIQPIDFTGFDLLGEIPVLTLDPWVGNPRVREDIPEALKKRPVIMTPRHGSFARGKSLPEALYYTALLENSSKIIYESMLLGIDLEKARRAIAKPGNIENLSEFLLNGRNSEEDEKGYAAQFMCAFGDIFYMGLSPFGTGSVSIRNGDEITFAPCASRPNGFDGPILHEPLKPGKKDNWEISLHKAVYSAGEVGAAVFTLSPEAVAQGWLSAQNATWKIKPIDIEGQYHYPSIPLLEANDGIEAIAENAVKHKMAVVAGVGVLATGPDLPAAMHQVSSVRNICFYRTGIDCLHALGKGLPAKEFEK